VEALTTTWEAYILFEHLQHGPYQRAARNTLLRVRDLCAADFDALWQKLNVGDCPAWLSVPYATEQTIPADLQMALQRYAELRRAAKEEDVAAWQAVVEAGERLFALKFQRVTGVDWEALSEDLAGAYTNLCIAHEKASDFNASLAATERAIALQPNQAMWQRNRAGTLIDLGRLDEADQALATARAMEPGAARLKELEDQLAQVRAAKQGASAHE
jgi:tetratricopeptide (TPR) repeat protein